MRDAIARPDPFPARGETAAGVIGLQFQVISGLPRRRQWNGQHESRGALEYADIVSQLMRNNRRYRGAVLDQTDDAARLRKCLARRKPAPRCSERRRTEAAQAKAAAREE